jgi:hypothetical protein
MSRVDEIHRVLRDIQDDMANDASRFDGTPFNGRTVAEYLGNIGAAVAALARIVDEVAVTQRQGPSVADNAAELERQRREGVGVFNPMFLQKDREPPTWAGYQLTWGDEG